MGFFTLWLLSLLHLNNDCCISGTDGTGEYDPLIWNIIRNCGLHTWCALSHELLTKA